MKALTQKIVFLAFGFTFLVVSSSALAQSVFIANDFAAFENAMQLTLSNETTILCPSLTYEQLLAAENAEEYMLVYVNDEDQGFYMYNESKWTKSNLKEVFVSVHNHLQFISPSDEAKIFVAGDKAPSLLIDYNQHIASLNSLFRVSPRSVVVNKKISED